MNKNKVWKVVYFVATAFLSIGLILGPIDELRRGSASVALMLHLRYPLYLLNIIGVAKILALIGVWQRKWPTLREWAYAGLTINFVGAIASHLAVGDGITGFGPALINLVVLALSYIGLKKYMAMKAMRSEIPATSASAITA